MMQDRPAGPVRDAPLVLLRLEGAALLGLAVLAFAHEGASWWLFAILFLAPDLSMLAYLSGPRIGAVGYNMAHTTLGGAGLAAIGLLVQAPLAVALAAIWLAHIGLDRLLGFGLKYETGFADTHLGRLGASAEAARLCRG